jgi:hypothetical protein
MAPTLFVKFFLSIRSMSSSSKTALIQESNAFPSSRTVRSLIYLISLLDFLFHYALTVEMGILDQIHGHFQPRSSNESKGIEICELPIRQHLPFHLSQLNVHIVCLSFIALVICTEAMRKSSFVLYRLYLIIKLVFVAVSLWLYIVNTLANVKTNFIHTPLLIPQIHNMSSGTLLNMATCFIYVRERMAVCLLAIFNTFIFCMSIEYASNIDQFRPR